MSSEKKRGKRGVRGLGAAAVAIAVGVVALMVRVLYDVFSPAGVAYAFGQSDGSTLFAPTVTAVVFWLLVTVVPFEVAVLIVKHLDWRTGRLEPAGHLDGWLAAHISLRDRARRRVKWWVAGAKASYRQFQRAVDHHAAVHAHTATEAAPAGVHDAPTAAKEVPEAA